MRVVPEFNPVARKVLCKRYLLYRPESDECALCGVRHETPEEMLERVSLGNEEFYNMMASLDFLPNSPTLFNAGSGQGTFSACFKFDVDDTMVSIMDVARKSAFVQKWGGGVGYCLSALRPKGAPIRSTQGRACGPVATLRLYHSVALMITQGGKREGAQMAILHCDHPDVAEFIRCKDTDPEAFSTFNLSVACTNDFMNKATSDSRCRESDLLHDIVECTWRTGDPGIYFIDTAEESNPTPLLGKLSGTNPCGEVPLLDNEPCNLGSINLSKFVLPDRSFDFPRLKEVAHVATRYLDEVLDHNEFPDPLITEMAYKTRKLGLGVMGWADTLALMRVPYDTGHAVRFGAEIMRLIQLSAHTESESLKESKGVCPALPDGTKRNATLTCIAPAGSIAVLAGCSSGIEPHFMLKGERMMGDGTMLPESLLGRFGDFVPKIAHEIDWSWHVDHQVAFQKCTDLAVSKTINIPNASSVQDVHDAFVAAWRKGCKGITVYRDGSRRLQVLTKEGDHPVLHARKKLPPERPSVTHKFSVGGTEGYVHVGLFEDGSPGEVFLSVGKQGSTVDGLLDAVAILTSLSIQYGVPLETIVNKLRGTRCEPAGLTENPAIPTASSLLDYIFSYVRKRFLSGTVEQTETGLFCPDCGSPALSQEGCICCSRECGWSRC